MSLEKIEGYASLRKDTANGGVINVDRKSFEVYKSQRLFAIQKNEEVKQATDSVSKLETEINNLKQDMSDIKSMLVTLIEKGK